MRTFWDELAASFLAGFECYRPLRLAWRGWRTGGLRLAVKTFRTECQRHWSATLLSVLAVLTLAVAGLAAALIAASAAWVLLR